MLQCDKKDDKMSPINIRVVYACLSSVTREEVNMATKSLRVQTDTDTNTDRQIICDTISQSNALYALFVCVLLVFIKGLVGFSTGRRRCNFDC